MKFEKKMKDIKILSHSAMETEAAGMLLAGYLEKNDFVAMYGDLGAGKTAFVRGMARVLAPGVDVCSPTYTIVNQYEGEKATLCHFDMYRIDTEDDLESIGFYDYTDCIIVAEWCEKIEFALPESYYRVEIKYVSADSRMITVSVVEKEVKR